MRIARIIVVLVSLMPEGAEAGLNVCNKSAETVRAALGRFDGKDWMSEGWWSISPRTCSRLVTKPLDARYYYLFATDGAAGTWEGGTMFCTSTGRFAIEGRGRCTRRGYDRKGFFRIDTGQEPDWTQSLSD